MIARDSGVGKTFAGAAKYLAHDPKAETQERVDWTHTYNLAEDDMRSAVNLMYLTAENAELLKQEAGVRAGGRATENPVKHWSLNWSPEDNPTKEHMIETTVDFIRHMGWEEHQAIFVAHNDKPYKHVHILLNAIHPETGLRLTEGYEHARAQKWALQYELSQERIYCEQRLLNENEREKNMPRNMWQEFQEPEQKYLQAGKLLVENAPEIGDARDGEWKRLKELQKAERLEYVENRGEAFKELRKEVYREVREEFRPRWAQYYGYKRAGVDKSFLAQEKAHLLESQKSTLAERRDVACQELEKDQKRIHRVILDRQQEQRGELRMLQDAKEDTTEFFREVSAPQTDRLTRAFGQAAAAITEPAALPSVKAEQAQSSCAPRVYEASEAAAPTSKSRDPVSHTALSIGGSIATYFFNLGSAQPEPSPADERADQFREAAENVVRQQQHSAREEEDAAWRDRQKTHARE